jgi:16S rRNA (cytidine1402-2'-O)-methyltransferase
MTKRIQQTRKGNRGSISRPADSQRREPPQGEPVESPCGTLYVVATPIGNREDITLRAIRILGEVQLIAAEDTRRTRILLDTYGIVTPLTSLYEQNEARKSGLVLARLQRGDDVAYVSDAGTPGISDPGHLLIREAISRGILVVPIPGASALLAALSASGLPMDSFVFVGFLPTKQSQRRRFLASLRDEERTLVFYESPRRLGAALEDMESQLGDRMIVVARELTKIYETFIRGTAAEILARLDGETVKGEVTLIVSGRSARDEIPDEVLLARYEALRGRAEGAGPSLRDAADLIATETGVSRRRIYQLLLFS